MTNFEKFKEQFDKDYKNVSNFMEKYEYTNVNIPYNGVLEANNDYTSESDSYGDGATEYIERIYNFADFNIYIKFNGSRDSYDGARWANFVEVKPSEKQVITFEPVKQ